MRRAERHRIRPSSPHYLLLKGFCHLAKNLYNHANYLVRQGFIKNGKWLRYGELDSLLKADAEYPDYRAMPTAQAAQQVLRLLDRNWKSFFAATKDFKEHPDKYCGRPRLPKYKRKDGLFILTMTNQNCKMSDGVIRFPKSFNGFTVRPLFATDSDAVFRQVRFVPSGDGIAMEIVYDIPDVDALPGNGRYAAMDIGVDNLAAVAMNTGARPLLVKGTPAKSMNQYYNKRLAKMRSILELMGGRRSSKRTTRLTAKRERKLSDYLHKASRAIVNACAREGISAIAIGKNAGWKQNANMGKRNNQGFVQLPFAKLIQMIQYKAEALGIKIILTEESYTSGTSFLDGELPTKEFYNKGRRKHRGLFVANDGRRINADVNGAFQIMKKAIPDARADGIEGVALRPVAVALA